MGVYGFFANKLLIFYCHFIKVILICITEILIQVGVYLYIATAFNIKMWSEFIFCLGGVIFLVEEEPFSFFVEEYELI